MSDSTAVVLATPRREERRARPAAASGTTVMNISVRSSPHPVDAPGGEVTTATAPTISSAPASPRASHDTTRRVRAQGGGEAAGRQERAACRLLAGGLRECGEPG